MVDVNDLWRVNAWLVIVINMLQAWTACLMNNCTTARYVQINKQYSCNFEKNQEDNYYWNVIQQHFLYFLQQKHFLKVLIACKVLQRIKYLSYIMKGRHRCLVQVKAVPANKSFKYDSGFLLADCVWKIPGCSQGQK